MIRPIRLAAMLLLAAGCRDSEGTPRAAAVIGRATAPEELPRMTNTVPPFRYPASLYDRKVQADVMLRLFIDEHGAVRPESTQVVTTSGHAALDSSAVEGARRLAFVPAKRRGEPVALSVLFPVLFRHPEATPLPGDSAFRGAQPDTLKSAPDSAKTPRPSAPRSP